MIEIKITYDDKTSNPAELQRELSVFGLCLEAGLPGFDEVSEMSAPEIEKAVAALKDGSRFVETGTPANGADGAAEAPNPAREPGKPAPGRQRRTKAEIAEDEARSTQAGAGAFDTPAISTGEERINPEDAKDEAAEAQQRDADGEDYPTDKLRRAMNRFAELVGPADAIDKIRPLLGGKAPIELSDDEALAAVGRIEQAIADLNKPAGSIVDNAPMSKSLDDWRAEIKAGLLAYAEKFDKTSDMAQAKFAQEDGKAIFEMVWPGQPVKLSTLPDEPEKLAKVVSAISRAISSNYFKR